MGKVVHFEIPADDLSRAQGFYGSVFGWQLLSMDLEGGTPYTLANTVAVDDNQRPVEPGAINGGLMRRSDQAPHPVITIDVDAIDDALGRVEAEGGKTVQPRTEIPGMGAFAYFTDTEGNVMGLWETTA